MEVSHRVDTPVYECYLWTAVRFIMITPKVNYSNKQLL